MSDYSTLAHESISRLAEFLVSTGDNISRQKWIDRLFDDMKEVGNYDELGPLAWRANDVAVLLNKGHLPNEIRECPYRGIVAGPDDGPAPHPMAARPDRSIPPKGFKLNPNGGYTPDMDDTEVRARIACFGMPDTFAELWKNPLPSQAEIQRALAIQDLRERRFKMGLPTLSQEQLDALLDGHEPGQDAEELHQATPRFTLLSAQDVQSEPRAPWTIRGIAPRIGLGAVVGPPGVGKGFLILNLLAHVAENRPWFGHAIPEPRPVVYVVLEGWGGMADRIRAWEVANDRPLPSNIHFVRDALDLRSASARQALAEAIREAGAGGGLLVVDTLARAAPGADENSVVDMGDLIAGATELAEQLHALAILVHHVGKDASKGLRGHSSLLGALDFSIELSRAGDVRTWTLSKSKDGEDGITGMFRLRSVELGNDPETGEPISSCVADPIEPEDGSPMIRRPAKPKTGNRRIIFDKLGELLRKAGERRPENAPASLPQGRPCVRLEEVIGQLGEALTCEPKRRGERARSALASLISEGHYKLEDGHLWSP